MPLNEKYVDGLEFCKNPHNGFGENQGVGLKKLLEGFAACRVQCQVKEIPCMESQAP